MPDGASCGVRALPAPPTRGAKDDPMLAMRGGELEGEASRGTGLGFLRACSGLGTSGEAHSCEGYPGGGLSRDPPELAARGEPRASSRSRRYTQNGVAQCDTTRRDATRRGAAECANNV
jgi:hypothetical protein